jgi:ubiquinone/menaquinone biosynthesis C-methylase UbiE
MNDFIKETWEKQAAKYKDSHWVSWGDNFAISLEIENISQYIHDGYKILDVGCANGFATMRQFKNKKIDITGVDFSESMIKYAKDKLNELEITEGIRFSTGDVRKLGFDDGIFDLTYTTRVLINLPNWEEQKQGISECLRVTKKGGMVILSEAFWEPLVLLNAMRTLVKLPPLVEHDFNRYIKEKRLEEYLTSSGYKFEVIDFSSVYYLGSRFLRELVTEIGKYPGFSNPINEIFYNIEKDYSGGGFGIQKAVVITNATNK